MKTYKGFSNGHSHRFSSTPSTFSLLFYSLSSHLSQCTDPSFYFAVWWMSDNRSSPTPNTAINYSTLSLEIPSRAELYENAGLPPPSRVRTTPSTRALPFIHHFHPENAVTRHPRPSESSPDHRLSKKMRMLDSEESYTGRSSPSNSSQSDRGDHGSEGEQTLPPASPTTYEFAEPKKKRTRTLTTPHQAAVLHALLAQSRFPTTAMREEVGKQIGLSARKVQIWFQNQRQKARRPPPQSATSTNRSPPIYGPFSPPGAQSSTNPSTEFYGTPQDPSTSHSTNSRQAEHPWASGQRRRGLDGRFLPPEDGPQSLTPGFWLSGPGMPGATQNEPAGSSSGQQHTSHSQSPREVSSPNHHSTHSHHAMPTRRHSQSPPRMRIMSRSSSVRTGSGETRDRSFSRTLPPLVFDRSYTRGNHSPSSPVNYQLPLTTRSAPSAIEGLPILSSQFESPFAHDPQESRPLRDIPPPFALQPLPQWDKCSISSRSRPSTSSWSRPSTSYSASGESLHTIRSHERVVSDLLARQHVRDAGATPRQSPITRRFDPVHDSVSANEANRYASVSPTVEHNNTRDQQMVSPR